MNPLRSCAAGIGTFFIWALACQAPQSGGGAAPHPLADTVQLGAVVDACEWPVPKEVDEHGAVVLDIVFLESDTLPHRAPSDADLAVIAAVEGEVLYRYHLRAVRARMPAQRVPELNRKVNAAYYVPTPGRHDLRVLINYTRPPTEDDKARLAQLGGRVLTSMLLGNGVVAVLPDDAMRQLWARPEVWSISPDGLECLS